MFEYLPEARHLAFVPIVAWGLIGNAYETYARSRNWPVGSAFPRWAMGAVVVVPLSLAWVWYASGWRSALLILAAGYGLAWLLTVTLKQYVQPLWFAGLFVAGAAALAAFAREIALRWL